MILVLSTEKNNTKKPTNKNPYYQMTGPTNKQKDWIEICWNVMRGFIQENILFFVFPPF